MLRDYAREQEWQARRQQERKMVAHAFGEFIAGLALWAWWVTITFRNEVYSPQIGIKTVKAWLDDVAKMAEPSFSYVLAEEFGGIGGRFHCHLLVSGVGELRRDFWWREAFRRFGRSKVEPFDAKKGAAFYAAKYTTKQLGNLHFGGAFEGCAMKREKQSFELLAGNAQATVKRGFEILPSDEMPRDFYRLTLTKWHR